MQRFRLFLGHVKSWAYVDCFGRHPDFYLALGLSILYSRSVRPKFFSTYTLYSTVPVLQHTTFDRAVQGTEEE